MSEQEKAQVKANNTPQEDDAASGTSKAQSVAASSERISRRTLLMLIVLLGSTLSGSFAQIMMNIALPTVSSEFHVDLTTANWIVVGYNVMAGTAIIMTASLLRRLGLRKLLTLSACCLCAGSILGCFSVNFPLLVAARLLQAIATGINFPIVSASIEIIVPKGRQGIIFALNSGGIGLGQAAGPLVTGFLLTHFGIGVTFIVPAVLGGLLIIVSLAWLHDIEPRASAHLDALSIVLAFAGLATFMYGMSEITHRWVPALICVCVGGALLAGFNVRQLKLPKPLLNVATLRYATFTVGIILIMLGMMASIAMSLLLPLFYEGTAGDSAFGAGLLLFWPLLVYCALSLVAGRLFDRHPQLPFTSIGFGLILAALIGIHFVAKTRSVWGVFGCSFPIYVGVSFIVPPTKATALAALPKASVADGASVNSTFVQVAECFAAALFVGVLSADVLRLTGKGVARAEAYAEGFASTIWISIFIAAASFVLAVGYYLKNRPKAGTSKKTAAQ